MKWLMNSETGKRCRIVFIAELAALRNDNDEFTPLPESDDDLVNENRRRVKNSIRLDVKTINVEIPKDVQFPE